MSTPPGPYGQQPYGQTPYGQPYPQPQSYPQGPQSPYSPYAQAPQAGWGVQPPLPPLPPQRNTGKVIAVVVGAIAFFAVGGAGLLVTLGGGGGGTQAEYKLTVPRSLESGKYTLQQDISQKLDSDMAGSRSGYGAHDMRGAAGEYQAASGGSMDRMSVTGLYGTIDDPDLAKDHFLHGMENAKGTTTVAVPSRVITPSGSSEPLTCEVLNAQVGVRTLPTPVCVWADNGTLAAVMKLSAANLTANAVSIDLNAFADEVNTIRGEIRVKL
ncbi:hypothetical protein ABZ746_32230 [Streptomyces sp. NPDC020096]